ncbi:MAG TPA: histidine kinase dimerization/phospho-acceptor domain-containing protein, partial [Pseudomonadales bacterium]|nr:histidine kinase dimerization/phospho-acceptor domain-containing protein [Pseudomonadales bacterium]
MTYLAQLFGVSNYMPHGYCFLWRPDLLMLHVGSDAVITLSYFSIPAAILMMVRKRPDADHRVAQLFIAFIALCGLTHLMNIVVIWYPAYAIEGLIKLATALVSLTTAVVLWPLIPRIAAMPSRQQLEQRNREIENLNSKLQQRIDSLGTLAGGVAHDFNNLLTVIKGHAHLLEQSRERDTINENLQAITIAADRAADVCRQMLAYSGRGHFMLVPTDLNSIVGEVKMSGQSGCNLTYSLSTNLHTIDASAEQMHQLVNDLVNNCIEAIQEAGTAPGEVSIQTYNATLSEADLARAVGNHDMTPGDAVILEVTDNGVGMPPQVIDRLFEPYYSTKFVGRGLGMAAVQG